MLLNEVIPHGCVLCIAPPFRVSRRELNKLHPDVKQKLAEEEKESLTPQTEYEFHRPAKVAPSPVAPSPPKQQAVEPKLVSAPAPAAAESILPTSLEPSSEIEKLRLNWKQVIDEAPASVKKTNAIALLRSAGVKPVDIKDDTVVLSFRYEIHKENIEKPENQQVAEKIIANFLGRPCHVRCIYEPEDNHLVRAALKMGAQVTSVEEK